MIVDYDRNQEGNNIRIRMSISTFFLLKMNKHFFITLEMNKHLKFKKIYSTSNIFIATLYIAIN